MTWYTYNKCHVSTEINLIQMHFGNLNSNNSSEMRTWIQEYEWIQEYFRFESSMSTSFLLFVFVNGFDVTFKNNLIYILPAGNFYCLIQNNKALRIDILWEAVQWYRKWILYSGIRLMSLQIGMALLLAKGWMLTVYKLLL